MKRNLLCPKGKEHLFAGTTARAEDEVVIDGVARCVPRLILNRPFRSCTLPTITRLHPRSLPSLTTDRRPVVHLLFAVQLVCLTLPV